MSILDDLLPTDQPKQPEPEVQAAPKQGSVLDDLLGDQQQTQAAAPKERSLSSVPMEALSNIPGSAASFASNIAQPFIHPIDTATGIKNIGQGALEKAGVLSGAEHVKYADAAMKFLSDRYGGWEELKKTAATDPVGFAADLSAVLTGGGSLAARSAGVAGKLGETAASIGRTVDPINLASAAAKGTIKTIAPAAEDASTLAAKGVTMTPGQIIGGYPKALEDAITSIPYLGSWVSSGRGRSIESFNKAVGNQALEPIGEALSKKTSAGHETIAEVESKLSSSYDKLLPNLKFSPDKQYAQDMQNIMRDNVAMLPAAQQKQYITILNKKLPSMTKSGDSFKKAESTLSTFASNYSKSSVAAERDLGATINNVITAMRSNLERSNPAHAAELAKINSGWAMYTRMRDAAVKGSEGVFTPAQLLSAVKAGDRSVRKGSFAKGDALMQIFAETGQRVLPSKLPSSGTSERAAVMAALAGGSYLLHSPHIIGAGAAAIAPYTRPGMWAINKAAFGKPSRYIPRGAPQAAFQLGRASELGQKRGGEIKESMSRTARRAK